MSLTLIAGVLLAGPAQGEAPEAAPASSTVDARCQALFAAAMVTVSPAKLVLEPARMKALGAKEFHPYAKRFPKLLLFVVEFDDAAAAKAGREQAQELMEKWSLIHWTRSGINEELVLVVGLEADTPPDVATRGILDNIAKIFSTTDME